MIPKQSSKGHCSYCQLLRERIRNTKPLQEKNALRVRLSQHREWVALERRHYHQIREHAGGSDDEHDSIHMDAMDWHRTSLPHFPEVAKDLEGTYQKYKQKLTGAKAHGLPRPYFLFLNNLSVKPDTNLNIHLLLRILQQLGRPVKKKLKILLDNTVAGNKTIRLFGLLGMLVQYGVVDEVKMHCLVKPL